MEVRNESGGLIVLSETLTGKEYIFSVENPNPCDLYSFTVTPLCGTVEGETSAVKNGTFLAGKQDQLTCLLHIYIFSTCSFNC